MVKEVVTFNHKLELYEVRGARGDRVVWAAIELGLEDHLTLKTVGFAPKDENMTQMKKHNPMGQFPTMVLTAPDGKQTVVTESCSIAYLLAEMCGRLQPAAENVFARAQYLRMMSFAASSLDKAVTTVFFNQMFAQVKDMDAEAAARKTFDEKVSKVLEEILDNDGNPVHWVCEPHHDGFTAADIVVGWSLQLADKVNMLDNHPTLKAYVCRIAEREAFAKLSAKQ